MFYVLQQINGVNVVWHLKYCQIIILTFCLFLVGHFNQSEARIMRGKKTYPIWRLVVP